MKKQKEVDMGVALRGKHWSGNLAGLLERWDPISDG